MSNIPRPVYVQDAKAFQQFYPLGMYYIDGKQDLASGSALLMSVALSHPLGDDGGPLFSLVTKPSFGSSIVAERDVVVAGTVSINTGAAGSAHTFSIVYGDFSNSYGQDVGGTPLFGYKTVVNQDVVSIPFTVPLAKGTGMSITCADQTISPTGLCLAVSMSPA